MAFVAADWSIDRQTKNITYIGDDHTGASPSYATVIEFHRALQDFADQEGFTGDDELDITDPTPSDRSTDNIVTLINGWNIDDNAAEHVYDGSIIQTNGDVIYDGIKILAPVGTAVQFLQNGAIVSDDWWNYQEGGTHSGSSGAAVLTDGTKSWTVDQWVGYRIKNTTDGSFATITSNTATTITGALEGGTDNDWDASDAYLIFDGLNSDTANGVSHNFMLKVRTGAVDTDGRRLIATTREWRRTYLEFKVNGTTRGINVVALAAAADLNNTTSATTVGGAGYDDITNQNQGYIGIDVDNNGANEFYYSRWTLGDNTVNDFYERLKYLSRDGSGSTLYGLNGEVFRGITHEITVDGQGVTDFSAFEAVSWSGGTGQMLAVNDVNAATKIWIQLLTGVTPTDNQTITGATSGATCLVNVTVTDRTISAPFVGVSTGSAIIGAYGLGVLATDLTQNDKLFDLTNTQVSPPNFVTFTVGGIVSGDRVLVGPSGFRFAYDGEASGPFTVGETLTFTSPAGTAVLAELVDSGTTGYMVIGPMVTGSTPVDNSTIAGATATANVNGSVANAINTRQFTLNGALTGAAVTSVVVNGTIPADTPSTGTIRILRADGQYTRHAYTAWATSTFTIGSTDFSSNNAANGANTFLSYIDTATSTTSESFTGVYAADRALFIRVRNGAGGSPIKTFETTGTLTNAGGSTTAIRTSDA